MAKGRIATKPFSLVESKDKVIYMSSALTLSYAQWKRVSSRSSTSVFLPMCYARWGRGCMRISACSGRAKAWQERSI